MSFLESQSVPTQQFMWFMWTLIAHGRGGTYGLDLSTYAVPSTYPRCVQVTQVHPIRMDPFTMPNLPGNEILFCWTWMLALIHHEGSEESQFYGSQAKKLIEINLSLGFSVT